MQKFADVFSSAQRTQASHSKGRKVLLKELKKATSKDRDEAPKVFFENFMDCFNRSLLIFKREAAAERIVNFATTFVAESCQVDECRFLQQFLTHLMSLLEAKDKAVRFRACQAISKTMHALNEDADIDDIWDPLQEALLKRTGDKIPVVRVQAINSLGRMQDVRDSDCPVVAAYISRLTSDSSPDVRRAALLQLGLSKLTMPAILSRTRDVKDTVRAAVFKVMADNVDFHALQIADRAAVLGDGLKDRSGVVRAACHQLLVRSWLPLASGVAEDLIDSVDPLVHTDVALSVGRALLEKGCKPWTKLPAHDALTPEAAVWLQAQVAHAKAAGLVDLEEQIAGNLAWLTEAIGYWVDQAVRLGNSTSAPDNGASEATFIAITLMSVTKEADTSNEVARRCLIANAAAWVRAHYNTPEIVAPAVDLLAYLHADPHDYNSLVVELLRDLNEPVEVMRVTLTKSERRAVQVETAQLKVEAMTLEDKKEAAIKGEDFEAAESIKKQLAQIAEKRSELEAKLQPQAVEQRPALADVDAILRARLTVLNACLIATATHLPPESHPVLVDQLVLTGVQHSDADIRNLAVSCLSLFSCGSRAFAERHILLLLQVAQVDQEAIQYTALQGLFDLLLTFGPAAFGSTQPTNVAHSDSALDDENEGDAPSQQAAAGRSAVTIIPVLERYLDAESDLLRLVAAEGFAKLLLHNRVSSPKILSRLLLLYFSPTSEEQQELRQCLSVFFPAFAFAERSHQDDLQQALLPTTRAVLVAPPESPLAAIKAQDVADMIIYLTGHQPPGVGVKSRSTLTSLGVHPDLTLSMANEILSEPASPHNKVFLKAFSFVDFTTFTTAELKSFYVLLEQIGGSDIDRACGKLLDKAIASVEAMLGDEANAIDSPTRAAVATSTKAHDDQRRLELHEQLQQRLNDETANPDSSMRRLRRTRRKTTPAIESPSDNEDSGSETETEGDELVMYQVADVRSKGRRKEYLVQWCSASCQDETAEPVKVTWEAASAVPRALKSTFTRMQTEKENTSIVKPVSATVKVTTQDDELDSLLLSEEDESESIPAMATKRSSAATRRRAALSAAQTDELDQLLSD